MKNNKWCFAAAIFAATALSVVLPAEQARADLTTYTDATEFTTALAAAGYPSSVLDFEAVTAGTNFISGASIGDVTFQNFGPRNIIVTDQYATTSGSNYLGMSDTQFANQFVGGFEFEMQFANSHAIGFFVITGEAPGFSIFDNDIQLTVPGVGTASLDVDDLQGTIGGSDQVFFIGMIETSGTFTNASIEFDPAAVGAIVFNVDDVTTSNEFQLGDVNRDGDVNLLDVAPFVTLLSNGIYQLEADTNQDGDVNLLDVDPFVAILGGG